MAVCWNGHSNVPEARFCTRCGVALARVAEPPPTPPPGSGRGWGPPAGSTGLPQPPAAHLPGGGPGAPARRGRRPVVIAAVAGFAVGLLVSGLTAVAVTSRDGHEETGAGRTPTGRRSADRRGSTVTSDDLTVVARGAEGHGRLFLLHQGDPVAGAVSFGRGAVQRIHVASAEGHPWGDEEGSDRPAIVAVPGGALVAWRSGDLVTVATVRVGDPEPDVRYRGGSGTEVGVLTSAEGARYLTIKDRGACRAGELDAPLEEIGGEHDGCEFQDGGLVLTSSVVGKAPEQRRYTAWTLDGVRQSVIEPRGSRARLVGGFVVVDRDADDDGAMSPGSVLVDPKTGDAVVDGQQGPVVAGTADGVVRVADGTPRPRFEELDRKGEVVRSVDGDALQVHGTSDGTLVAASVTGKTGTVLALPPGGGKAVRLLTGPEVGFLVLPDDRVLAWDSSGRVAVGPATRALAPVDAPDGIVGIDDATTAAGASGVLVTFRWKRGADRDPIAWLDGTSLRLLPVDGGTSRTSRVEDAGPLGVVTVATAPGRAPGDDDVDVLVVIDPEGRAVELDRGGIVEHPRFDGHEVVYQWRQSWDDEDPTEIRRVRVVDGAQPRTVEERSSIAVPASPAAPAWWGAWNDAGWVRAATSCPTGLDLAGRPEVIDVHSPTTDCLGGTGRPGTLEVTAVTEEPIAMWVTDWAGRRTGLERPARGGRLTVRTEGWSYQLHLASMTGEYETKPVVVTVRFTPDP